MVRHTLQQILQPKQKITSYILISILSAICAFARTSTLSQIQDTVMTPSGTPFNGMVVITWTGTTSTS
ncbi:MAG TPA: hypothetical protein VFA65_01075, partial [Bryobacteraceae bacterium]|nr:hypothetical protein [Bryobacteraceae bacterium]